MIGVRLVHFEGRHEFDDSKELLKRTEWWQKRFIIQLSMPWGKRYYKKPTPKVKYG